MTSAILAFVLSLIAPRPRSTPVDLDTAEISESSYDVAAFEVNAISHKALEGVVILLNDYGRPVRVAASYHRDGSFEVPGKCAASLWLNTFGAKDAVEMLSEAHDEWRAKVGRLDVIGARWQCPVRRERS